MSKYRCSICGWSGDNPAILNNENVLIGSDEKFDDIKMVCPRGCKDEDGDPKMVYMTSRHPDMRSKRIDISLPRYQLDWLNVQSKGKSRTIQELIEKAMASHF